MTLWTVAHQAPLSMGERSLHSCLFPRQEYWNGLPFPPPEDLPNPGIKPASPALAGGFFTTMPPEKPGHLHIYLLWHWHLKKTVSLPLPPNTHLYPCNWMFLILHLSGVSFWFDWGHAFSIGYRVGEAVSSLGWHTWRHCPAILTDDVNLIT